MKSIVLFFGLIVSSVSYAGEFKSNYDSCFAEIMSCENDSCSTSQKYVSVYASIYFPNGLDKPYADVSTDSNDIWEQELGGKLKFVRSSKGQQFTIFENSKYFVALPWDGNDGRPSYIRSKTAMILAPGETAADEWQVLCE